MSDEHVDYRFTLANERTFLAWIRTSLALVGGGLAVYQFLTAIPTGMRVASTVVLMVMGVACSVNAAYHWTACDKSISADDKLPHSKVMYVLPVAIGLAVIILGGGMLWQAL